MIALVGCFIISELVINHENDKVWNNSDVTEYVKQNKPVNHLTSDDPFAAIPIPTQPAAEVLLSYPVRRFASPRTEILTRGTWEYDRSTEIMKVRIDNFYSDMSILLGPERATRPRERATLYSTITDVWIKKEASPQSRTTEIEQVGFAEPVYSRDRSIFTADDTSLKHEWKIEPEVARSLSDHLTIEVIGETKAWAPDTWVVCASDIDEILRPTPNPRTWNGCYLTGTIKAVRLVDGRDGTTLRQWSR